jgi:hypothetical protein
MEILQSWSVVEGKLFPRSGGGPDHVGRLIFRRFQMVDRNRKR